MTILAALRRIDLRVLIIGLAIVSICAIFWLNPHYSSLQGKAAIDPDEALSTPLGFESYFPEPRADEKLKRIVWNAVQWAVTYRHGITFALLLAAGLLTIAPLVEQRHDGNVAGSLRSLLASAPLGGCFTCALPASQAMRNGARRIEVASIFSSASFNVVVVGFLFTLFPLFLVVIKLITALLMVLVVSPRLSRRVEPKGSPKGPQDFTWPESTPILHKLESGFRKIPVESLSQPEDNPQRLLYALGWTLTRYSRNLWIVVRVALPLTMLGALLGAALVELVPWTRIAQIAQVEGWMPNAAILILVVALGTLLPVPVITDVIICAVLWDVGVPMYVVAALLVTLGMYSAYTWRVIGTLLSRRLAAFAGAAVSVLGIAAGATAGVVDRWHDLYTIRKAAAMLEELPAPKLQPVIMPPGRSAAELRELAPPLPPATRLIATNEVELWSAPFIAAAATTARTPFARIEGARVGFDRLPLPRTYQLMQMGMLHLGSLAAGDVNGDGRADVAVGTHAGVLLYVNLGGEYALQEIAFSPMREWIVSVVALVDLDGDRALDLFFCTWMHGCHILFNRDGSFSSEAHLELPRFGETAVTAVAFADVDRNGLLDIVTGTSTSQPRFFYPAPAVNRLWRNRGGKFEPEALQGPEGDTLTLLFSDLNGDGWPDLFVGNDFDEPDRIYLNDHGVLRPVKGNSSPIPHSTKTTMSVDTGDLNNDGRDELYVGQIAMGKGSETATRLRAPVESCDIYTDIAERSRCNVAARFQIATVTAHNGNTLDPCVELPDPAHRRDCIVMSHHWWRVLVRLPALGADKATVLAECARIPSDFETLHDVCGTVAQSEIDNDESELVFADEIPSLKHYNLLFASDANGFKDVTAMWGAGFGGWTWNAKFADLDNDTWQDLYIAQGSRLRASGVSAIFYRNQGGTTFKDETKSFGLEDHVPTGAYLYLDYDLDGDLDIITRPFQLTPVVMRNDSPKGAGLQIELDDQRSANRFAIGARVEIRAPDGRLQVRDIKASGGYASSDAPLAFFGLGTWPSVNSIKVTWPDGESSTLQNVTIGSGRYLFKRLPRQ